ncbi:late secretory pathway protein AVL9 homolog isoform X2 [Brevipalpus obovatus]|uniref:late secretory pathway protein AVL9 homolog isoform X2 n=1 Tax=Brevipalpus obovatus TaxID=246614 RepID=UPI003D9E5AA7
MESIVNEITDESVSLASSNSCLNGGPILCVLVVGFHHKKGCQIEYCFPDLDSFYCEKNDTNATGIDGESSDVILEDKGKEGETDEAVNVSEKTKSGPQDDGENFREKLPEVWKTLPSIALPDGAHNYERDTIYFHLPHPIKPSTTVFGISCYRQIPAEKLQKKSSDITRGTVQKSVVVLSELSLYGLIAAKCEMITYAYFNEFDFSKVDSLKELYYNLNSLLTKDNLNSSEVFLGLSPRDLLITFQHKILVLFKLLLLEKKVLFYKSPVKDLCSIILTLVSLIPGMLETEGLNNSSTSVIPKTGSDRKFSDDIELINSDCNSSLNSRKDIHIKSENNSINETSEVNEEVFPPKDSETDTDVKVCDDDVVQTTELVSKSLETDDLDSTDQIETEACNSGEQNRDKKEHSKIREETSTDSPSDSQEIRSSTPPLFKLPPEDCGLPLQLFGEGSFCHPYLSITYLDILSDQRVRSCIVGATNFLFKQKKDLFDVIVDIDEDKVEIHDPDLKKALSLTTQDLRFADFLVKTTMEGQGCDDWLRYQFKVYLLHLMHTVSECEANTKEYASFNPSFINSWKMTRNYRIWSSNPKPGVQDVVAGHPCQGQLGIADFKLRFSQAVFNTERGKKLNQTIGQTSKVLSNAKTAVSSWWSSQWSSINRNRQSNPNSNSSGILSTYSLSGLMKSLEKGPSDNSTESKEEVV